MYVPLCTPPIETMDIRELEAGQYLLYATRKLYSVVDIDLLDLQGLNLDCRIRLLPDDSQFHHK